MKQLLSIIYLAFCFTSFSQKKLYHEYHPTASDNVVTRWNIGKDSAKLVKWTIEETTDKLGRVIEIKFLEDGKLGANTLCYLPDIVKYSYPDKNTIVESFYDSRNMATNSLECESPSKIIYKLNDKEQIVQANVKFNFDEAGMIQEGFSKESIATEYAALKKQMTDKSYIESYAKFVSYYLKSFSKLNRRFPINVKLKKEEFFSQLDNAESIDAALCLKLK